MVNVATMRLVDRWVGIPLCGLLTAWRGFRWVFRPEPEPEPIQKIAFLKLAEQGSTVLAYAALQRAVEMVGAENVYFVAFEQNRFILDVMEVIPEDNVIAIKTGSLPQTMLGTWGAVREIRRLGIDAVVDLEFFARSSSILAYMSGAQRRVGLHAFAGDGPWRGNLMTHRLLYNPHLHTSSLFRMQVDALEFAPDRFPAFDHVPPEAGELPRGQFTPRPGELDEVARLVRDVTKCESSMRLVLLNANCSDLLPLRRWDDANYEALAKRLLDENPDLYIAFTGAPSEAAAVQRLVGQIGSERCVSLAGKTTLRQLLVVYCLADVLVTNDSGPAHFASLTPIHVVTLFGPETPKLFGVLSERGHVHWAQTACSPCVNAYNNRVSTCTNNVCMQQIKVDDVYGTVSEILKSRRQQVFETEEVVEETVEEFVEEEPPPRPRERRRRRRWAE